ncbi:MerR family transcriptional regulator [Streptomyces sp. JJ38]|uniref:MerR family transcriptional regulator n=1 Tax=Streptomyces sp. JJ38 TaxID=2738128 RepID=UPI001C5A0D82|nr:MerR family transcriptional regulator [Streptomyces sp. JJ38]MBW1599307.1 MerR family transcriptional regulator [Streptomyces sp. JJ38]
MRAVDVARTAGISAQQVRNYVDAGVLPEVTRTAADYRVFTQTHVRALRAVRALAAGHGWAVARTVMRAVHAGDVPAALAALDAAHAELDRERLSLTAVLAALDDVLKEAEPTATGERRIGDVAAAVGVKPPVLRLWEAHGLLRPARERGTGYRVYSPAEARLAHVVALLRRGSYPLPLIGTVLAELRATSSTARVRAELAHRERELHRRSLNALRGAAALQAYLDHLGTEGDVAFGR